MQNIPYFSKLTINLHITKKEFILSLFNMAHTLNFHIQDSTHQKKEQKLHGSSESGTVH